MCDVFISYAREDHAEAKSIADALAECGLSVSWDRTIPTGRTFEVVIEQAIAAAGAVVVLWSRHSVRSDWVRAEASEGANRGILVPASLDGEPPPLRYRVAQTADLTDWTPGRRTDSFSAFIADVGRVALRDHSVAASNDGLKSPGPAAPQKGVPHISLGSLGWIRRSVDVSLAFAWLGSLALAVTMAFDYGLITNEGASWELAYLLTLASLVGGAASSALLGGLSFSNNFRLGTLQGWVWPVLAAVAQLVILMTTAGLVRSLPFANELERLLIFVLCGTIGPGLLTVGGLTTKRTLRGSPQGREHR